MREAWLFCNGSWISLGRSALGYHLIAHRNATLPLGTVRYWGSRIKQRESAHVHRDLFQISGGPLPHLGTPLQ
jgi:hypothetical protein